MIIGETLTTERQRIIHEFKNGKLDIIFTVDVFNEGVDIPCIDTILFLRPTISYTIFIQQLGRGLRTFEDKEKLRVIDFVGNYKGAELKPSFLAGENRNKRKISPIDSNFILPSGCTANFDFKLIDENYRMSFNLSVKTFSRNDLIPTIEELLKKYKVPGEYIEVEITESILVKDIQDILSKLASLINLSIQVSLDDFTAGHSTARLLPILPINIIKFDKSLLDSLDENEKKAKIIYQNLTSMIKGLNLKIVSEGIETSDQLEFLKSLNIDYGQGYLVSRPLPKDSYLSFLQKY